MVNTRAPKYDTLQSELLYKDLQMCRYPHHKLFEVKVVGRLKLLVPQEPLRLDPDVLHELLNLRRVIKMGHIQLRRGNFDDL